MLEGGEREETGLTPALRLLALADRAVTGLTRAVSRARKRRRGQPIEVLVRLGWRLGDEVMAIPVYEALSRRLPPVRVSARVRHPELLERNPYLHQVNPLTLRPDLVIDLKGEDPGVPRRVSLARRAEVSLAGIVPRVYLSEAERSEPALPDLGARERARVALHPGSSQTCKSWGPERWRAVARALAADGVAVFEVGLDRSPVGAGKSLVGRTADLRRLARLLAQVDLVLGDDSGPLHLALAVGTPAVGVFGATDPAGLYPDGEPLTPLVGESDCRFCWPARRLAYPSGVCPLDRHRCMEAVEEGSVLAAVRDRLRVPARVAP